MSECILTSGYTLGCKNALGGIQRAYLGNWTTGVTYTLDSESVITAISNEGTFYEIQQRNETGEFIEEGQHSIENGTNFWQQTVNLSFHKMEASLMSLIEKISDSDLIVIVLDQNNRYWVCGRQNGADVVASTSNIGKAYGDLNGGSISIMAKEPEPANEITSGAFDGITLG